MTHKKSWIFGGVGALVIAAALTLSPAIGGVGQTSEGVDRRTPDSRQSATDTYQSAPGIAAPIRAAGEHCEDSDALALNSVSASVRTLLPTNRSPDEIFTCGGQPLLMFGDVELYVETGWNWKPVPPDKSIADLASQGHGYTIDVDGRTAAVLPSKAPRFPQLVVLGARPDLQISAAAAPDVPLNEIVTVLRSLRLPAV